VDGGRVAARPRFHHRRRPPKKPPVQRNRNRGKRLRRAIGQAVGTGLVPPSLLAPVPFLDEDVGSSLAASACGALAPPAPNSALPWRSTARTANRLPLACRPSATVPSHLGPRSNGSTRLVLIPRLPVGVAKDKRFRFPRTAQTSVGPPTCQLTCGQFEDRPANGRGSAKRNLPTGRGRSNGTVKVAAVAWRWQTVLKGVFPTTPDVSESSPQPKPPAFSEPSVPQGAVGKSGFSGWSATVPPRPSRGLMPSSVPPGPPLPCFPNPVHPRPFRGPFRHAQHSLAPGGIGGPNARRAR